MLRGFTVSNYKSFDGEQSISFAASKIVRHKDHLVDINGKKILRSGLIFGANAGGKSNLIHAIAFSRNIILNGLAHVNLAKKHFRIKKENYNTPGVFQYDIMKSDNEYLYGIAVSYAKREIVGEWLIQVGKSGKEFVIFDRSIDDEGNSKIESDISEHSQKNSMRLQVCFEDFGQNISEALRRKTMLEDIAIRSNEAEGTLREIASIYEWFQDIIILFPDSKYKLINEIASDDTRRDFFQSNLAYFDTGIEAITGQKRAMDFDRILSDLPSDSAEEIKIQLSKETIDHPVTLRIDEQVVVLRRDSEGNIIYNKLLLDHGNPDDPFEYMDESDGTRRLFDLIPLLYNSEDPRVIFIDEIDRSLHTNLVHKFIEQFYSMTSNKQTQLIATTHDSNVLDLDLLRQDEIWFVERQEDHSSRIYSLNKFKERFDKVIKNEYIIGRYGAIPMFNSSFLSEVDTDGE